MNPLRHLPKEWEDLRTNQIWEVIDHYCDENKYEYEPPDYTGVNPISWFESQYYPIEYLIEYFNNWQN